MSLPTTNVAKIHVSCLRFSTDVEVGISVEHRERELIQIRMDDRSLFEKAADAAVSGLSGLFGMLTGAPRCHEEPIGANGRVLTYAGRQLPPKVFLTAPWGSAAHTLFEGEFERMIGAVMEIAPLGDYKFDIEVTVSDESHKLLGCFVRDYPQQIGDLAVIPPSIDFVSSPPEPRPAA